VAEVNQELANEMAAAVKAGTDWASEVFGGALDAPSTLTAGEHAPVDLENLPEPLDQPSLMFVYHCESLSLVAFLPESVGLLKQADGEPEEGAATELAKLAEELGGLLLPPNRRPKGVRVGRTEGVAEALGQAGDMSVASLLPVALEVDGHPSSTLTFVWPIEQPFELLTEEQALASLGKCEEAGSAAAESSEPSPAPATESPPDAAPPSAATSALEALPPYTQSLLRIRVPVKVTLAVKKQPVSKILTLGPGSIIQFEKSCEEMLTLEVGEQAIGQGEAVKVGDKFGIRLSSLILPDERFRTVQPDADSSQRTG